MIKGRMFGLALMAVALIPGVALATHFNDVSVTGDCEGWTATVNVTWRTDIYSGDLDFVIARWDDGTVAEDYGFSGTLGREVGDPAVMTYVFHGTWAGEFGGSAFGLTGDFHLVSAWDGGLDEATDTYAGEFACSVASEVTTWSTVKTLYR
jgi:hypothetical protein